MNTDKTYLECLGRSPTLDNETVSNVFMSTCRSQGQKMGFKNAMIK